MQNEFEQEEKPSSRVPYHLHPEYLIYNLNIPHGAEKLYCILNFYSKGKNGCFATNDYLSNLMFVDERTIAKYLSILEDWKYIVVKNKRKRNRKIFINHEITKKYSDAAHEVYVLKDVEMPISDKIEKAKNIFLKIKGK